MTKPYFEAFSVRDADDQQKWTRIGVAFPNSKGLTLLLDAMPPSEFGQYKIVVLPPKPKEAKTTAKRSKR